MFFSIFVSVVLVAHLTFSVYSNQVYYPLGLLSRCSFPLDVNAPLLGWGDFSPSVLFSLAV